ARPAPRAARHQPRRRTGLSPHRRTDAEPATVFRPTDAPSLGLQLTRDIRHKGEEPLHGYRVTVPRRAPAARWWRPSRRRRRSELRSGEERPGLGRPPHSLLQQLMATMVPLAILLAGFQTVVHELWVDHHHYWGEISFWYHYGALALCYLLGLHW